METEMILIFKLSGGSPSSKEGPPPLEENPILENRGRVFFMNNIPGCEQDVSTLSTAFEDIGYKCNILEKDHPERDYLQQLENFDFDVDFEGPLVVFFFGYGYGDNVFIDESDKKSFSYRAFCEKIKNVREGKPTVVVTNVCFKRKSNRTEAHKSDNILRATFHIGVKINGSNANGSLLTEAIRKVVTGRDGVGQKFNVFAACIGQELDDLKKDEVNDKYYIFHQYYGVSKIIQFP